MNEERIIQALTAYQGTEDSLKETVAVLSEELGDNWTETVFEKLGGLPSDLKEKLNHTFNYYAALMAWQETQGYLDQTEALDVSVQERLPVLKHWLEFFGDPGTDLYQQLENKLAEPKSEVASKQEEVPQEVQQETQQEGQPSEQKSEEKGNAYAG